MSHLLLSDDEIIVRILSGQEPEGFEELYRRYANKVRGKCLSMVKNSSVADDLVQDIFMKALVNLSGFRNASSFSTWLFSITYNHCISHLRAHKKIRFAQIEGQLEFPDEVDEVEFEDLMHSRSEKLNHLMEMLRPEDKAILLLKYHEGMETREIMKILKIEGESAAKMKLNRAKKRLAALFEKFSQNF